MSRAGTALVYHPMHLGGEIEHIKLESTQSHVRQDTFRTTKLGSGPQFLGMVASKETDAA